MNPTKKKPRIEKAQKATVHYACLHALAASDDLGIFDAFLEWLH